MVPQNQPPVAIATSLNRKGAQAAARHAVVQVADQPTMTSAQMVRPAAPLPAFLIQARQGGG